MTTVPSRLVLLAALALPLAGCLATSGPRIADYPSPRAAVMLLDLQRGLLAEGGAHAVPAPRAAEVIAAANAAAATGQRTGAEVVYVTMEMSPWTPSNWWFDGALERGSRSAGLDPRVVVAEPAARFAKSASDAFAVEALDRFLRERSVRTLVLGGLLADGCVTWTARGALNRGYRVVVLTDGVASMTDERRRDALADLRGRGVTLVESRELEALLHSEQ